MYIFFAALPTELSPYIRVDSGARTHITATKKHVLFDKEIVCCDNSHGQEYKSIKFYVFYPIKLCPPSDRGEIRTHESTVLQTGPLNHSGTLSNKVIPTQGISTHPT